MYGVGTCNSQYNISNVFEWMNEWMKSKTKVINVFS